jgi:hypothetical protein
MINPACTVLVLASRRRAAIDDMMACSMQHDKIAHREYKHCKRAGHTGERLQGVGAAGRRCILNEESACDGGHVMWWRWQKT